MILYWISKHSKGRIVKDQNSNTGEWVMCTGSQRGAGKLRRENALSLCFTGRSTLMNHFFMLIPPYSSPPRTYPCI